MEINQPEWFLNRDCPCISGCQGKLVFKTCLNCGKIILVCDEIGTIFLDPKNVSELEESMHAEAEEIAVCPKCSKIKVSKFRNSTNDEIISLGFKHGDYC